jgi:hypothetical protein
MQNAVAEVAISDASFARSPISQPLAKMKFEYLLELLLGGQ